MNPSRRRFIQASAAVILTPGVLMNVVSVKTIDIRLMLTAPHALSHGDLRYLEKIQMFGINYGLSGDELKSAFYTQKVSRLHRPGVKAPHVIWHNLEIA